MSCKWADRQETDLRQKSIELLGKLSQAFCGRQRPAITRMHTSTLHNAFIDDTELKYRPFSDFKMLVFVLFDVFWLTCCLPLSIHRRSHLQCDSDETKTQRWHKNRQDRRECDVESDINLTTQRSKWSETHESRQQNSREVLKWTSPAF